MQVIIVSPNLDPSKNVSGVSSVTKFIIENNPSHDYVHFELGRKDNEKRGLLRINTILHRFIHWKQLLKDYPNAIVHYNFPLEKQSILRDTPFMKAAIKNGNKMVVHVHGGTFLNSDCIPFPFRQILKHIFSWQVPFITLSEKEAETIRNRFRAKTVVSLPNCIDLRDAKLFERKYNKNLPLTLGYLGRIAQTKGMDYLLNACILLKERNIPFNLMLAGTEEVEGQFLPNFSKALGNQFKYCGCVSGEAKNDFLRSLDLLVMPTFFEGLPISLLESMSYGIVPVVTPVGSIPTVVTDYQNGIFIKVKDLESIVDAVAYLDCNRDKLEQMSVSSRNFIYNHFDTKEYINTLNSIYNHC